MDIRIAKATKEDLPYIREKIAKYLLDDKDIHWSQFFVARMRDKVVAFGRILDHADSFEIASLGVDYYQRKNGIGKRMLSFLVQQAQAQDRQRPIYGITHLPRFASKCGFLEVKDNYPRYLEEKRGRCHFHKSRLSIMKWSGKSG